MKHILVLILLGVSFHLYSQKRIHGIILGDCYEYKEGIKVYTGDDKLNYVVSNKYGEYKIKTYCDTCIVHFVLNNEDSIKYHYQVKSASRRINYRFTTNFHCDKWHGRYMYAGYLSEVSFAPIGFYVWSNYSPSKMLLSYKFPYASNIGRNNVYNTSLKYQFRNVFHDRAISLSSEWLDLKTRNLNLGKVKSEYSSNYKFFYYRIGIGIYSKKENSPFIATSIDLPVRILHTTCTFESDWNTNRFDYQVGISSRIKQFLPGIKYTSIFNLRFWEFGIGYRIIYQ
jgi:hypothetical protein